MNNLIINQFAAKALNDNARPAHGEFDGDFKRLPHGVSAFEVHGGHAYIEVSGRTAMIVEVLSTFNGSYELRMRKIEIGFFTGRAEGESWMNVQNLDRLDSELFFYKGLRHGLREVKKHLATPKLGRACFDHGPTPPVFELDLGIGSMRGTLRTENGTRRVYLRRA